MPHEVMATDLHSAVVPPLTTNFYLPSHVLYSVRRLKVLGYIIIADNVETP